MKISNLQPGIEIHDLQSQIINQDIRLFIKLPWDYERSEKTYPVLFCLDGNRSFPLYSTMSLIYETPGTKTTEILLVGVGYKIDDERMKGLAQWAAWRTRDFTPVHSERTEKFWRERLSKLPGVGQMDIQSGGARQFLQALQQEIIPFVEANYRASAVDRGLAGYSDGGLFALYALFHAPGVFKKYFAGSPSMWKELFEYEQNYASANKDLEARLFMTVGSNESDLLEPMQRMADHLRGRGYPRLEVLTHTFEGDGHASAYAASVSRALCVLYNEDWLNR